jgi:hypothetical protein
MYSTLSEIVTTGAIDWTDKFQNVVSENIYMVIMQKKPNAI